MSSNGCMIGGDEQRKISCVSGREGGGGQGAGGENSALSRPFVVTLLDFFLFSLRAHATNRAGSGRRGGLRGKKMDTGRRRGS